MRILHVLDHSIPLHSGYSFRTLAIVREQRRLGWEPYLLTSPKHGSCAAAEEDVDGLHFYRTTWDAGALRHIPLLAEMALMRATARRLLEVTDRVRPDVLHAHSPALNAIPAISVGRRMRIPVIYEVRAFWEDAAVDHGTMREWGIRYRLSRTLETYALRRVGHITTICEGLKRDIVARGVPQHRVTVVPNAVDIAAFKYGAAPDLALKAALGLAGNQVIGFIGSFYAYEGLDVLLSALPKILTRMPDVRVLLVGGGPQESALRALAVQLGVADKVVFAGRVSHAEVQRYYTIVDVFAYPRRPMRLTDLVTPLKPLEAMAQGSLLVASDVGGHKELIRDGVTGLLFRAGDVDALADAVVRILAHAERWPAIRSRGRNYVELERNWQKSVSRYREVFDRLALAI